MNAKDAHTYAELLIIGSGPGGYAAALHAKKLGIDVTLAEMEKYGGVCVHSGCMPSKALLGVTTMLHDISNSTNMGISSNQSVDFDIMNSWKDSFISQLETQIKKTFSANKVNLLSGKVEFINDTTANLTSSDSQISPLTIDFKNAIIATGSKPITLPGFKFDSSHILDSKSALSLKSIPKKIIIIGAGYIGMELSAIFARLGTQVDVIEIEPTILSEYELDISKVIQKHSENLGINFHLSESAQSWEIKNKEIQVNTLNSQNKSQNYLCNKVIVAIGRSPLTNTLNLDAIGIKPNTSGFIPTDNNRRTTVQNIFAIGDVTSPPMLAHKASIDGKIAVEAILKNNFNPNIKSIPSVVFTTPEIGMVGLTQVEAEKKGFKTSIGKIPYRSIGRSLLSNHNSGFVRIVSDASTGVILGGQIVGHSASELIAELGLAIQLGATTTDLSNTIHAHPTFSELLVLAAIASSKNQTLT